MSHIFISYSRKDLKSVERIITTLGENNLDIWIDRKDIPKGEELTREIYLGIERADAFLFLISPDSAQSDWCRKEIDYAVKNGKRILPIIIGDTDPKIIHSEISKRNWIFCREGQDDFNKAIEETRKTFHTDYEWLKHHTELQVKALKWEQRKDNSRLLRGKELREAEQQLAKVHTQKDPQPTKVQREYVLASQRNEIRIRRQSMIGLSVGFAIVAVLAVFAWAQRNTAIEKEEARATAQTNAEQQSNISRAKQLAAQTQINPDLALSNLLLGIESFRLVKGLPHVDTVLAEQALRDSLSLVSSGVSLQNSALVAFSPDGQFLVTTGLDKKFYLWDLTKTPYVPLELDGLQNGTLYFSPDSQWLAIANKDTVYLWNINNGTKKPSFSSAIATGHEGDGVQVLTFSSDGTWLATGGWDGTVRLWDMRNLQSAPFVLRSQDIYILALAFSPNGEWLASAGSTSSVNLWSTKNISSNSEPMLLDHEGLVSDLVFSPNGRWLATGTSNVDWAVRLWDMQNINSETEPIVFRNITEHISGGVIAFSPDSRWMATGNNDRENVDLWRLEGISSETYPLQLGGHNGRIDIVVFSPDGKWLATSSTDNAVRLWNMEAERPVPHGSEIIIRGHDGFVASLAFSKDGKWLATGSVDSTVRLTDLENIVTEPYILRNHTDYVYSTSFSPDNRWLATGSGDGVRLWNTQSLSEEPIFLQGLFSWKEIVFSPNSQWLAICDSNGNANLWNTTNLTSAPIVLYGREYSRCILTFSPDGNWLAIGNEEIASVWSMNDLSSNPLILKGHEQQIFSLSFSPDSKWLVTSSWDNSARLWDLNKPQSAYKVFQVPENIGAHASFSPDGQWLAVGSGNFATLLNMKNLSAEPVALPMHSNPIVSIEFSPNSQWLETQGQYEKGIRLWNTSELETTYLSLYGHEGDIVSLAFSSNNQWLATGDWNGGVRLWNLTSATETPLVLKGYVNSVIALSFSPDSQILATGSFNENSRAAPVLAWDHTARLWHMDPDYVLEIACQIVGRNFTQVEWSQYFPGEEYRLTCHQYPAGE